MARRSPICVLPRGSVWCHVPPRAVLRGGQIVAGAHWSPTRPAICGQAPGSLATRSVTLPGVGTRERILQAALECFDELGYEHATIAVIREHSGVSNGALFHHFASKEAIAGALYLEAMESVQEGYWAVLEERPARLVDAVRGVLAQQLGWIEANQELARFLYSQGHLDWTSEAGSRLRERNRDLAGAYRAWLEPFVARGEARELPMMVVVALVTGPAHAIARRWLAGQLGGSLLDPLDDLVEATSAALGGVPGARRRPRRARAVEGRVQVQLLDATGNVVAEGEAVAELSRPKRVPSRS